ncbi:hypothetical protein F511_25456 [Dorcoceras hygrometricum]|uniref:Uncharacterized protein n=1 Tax=Dorcoceras hygrometricum TaxID=472368 RepID=A0A2Z7CVV1_9LAMI|nr:hypothetical protein F511_25456 [Dorcoceras hygrometricum]
MSQGRCVSNSWCCLNSLRYQSYPSPTAGPIRSEIILSVKIWHHTFTAHMANQIKRRNVSSLTYENFEGGHPSQYCTHPCMLNSTAISMHSWCQTDYKHWRQLAAAATINGTVTTAAFRWLCSDAQRSKKIQNSSECYEFIRNDIGTF